MQGNRAIQKFGPVEASCFLYLRGVDGRYRLFPLLRLSTCPFPSIFPHQLSPIPRFSFQKFTFPYHNSVPITSRNWVSLVSLLICPICVLSVTL